MPKLKRDLTMEEQLARGPMDLPFLMLVVLLLLLAGKKYAEDRRKDRSRLMNRTNV